jgi:hypothetical protein
MIYFFNIAHTILKGLINFHLPKCTSANWFHNGKVTYTRWLFNEYVFFRFPHLNMKANKIEFTTS